MWAKIEGSSSLRECQGHTYGALKMVFYNNVAYKSGSQSMKQFETLRRNYKKYIEDRPLDQK